MNQYTAAELIAKVAANQLNGIQVERALKARGGYTTELSNALGAAMDAAERARNSRDGYFRNY